MVQFRRGLCTDQADSELAIRLLCLSPLHDDAGHLLVIEFVLPDAVDHADTELECRLMSDINMLAVTGGKERSAVEWKKLLSSECRLSACTTLTPGRKQSSNKTIHSLVVSVASL
jgi:hypothetical protein